MTRKDDVTPKLSGLSRGLSRALAATGLLVAAAICSAAPGTSFWLAPRSNVTFDRQMAEAIGSRARIIVLRAEIKGPSEAYGYPALVSRFKEAGAPTVLAYAWGSRFPKEGRIEADLLQGLNPGKPLAVVEQAGNGPVAFLDVTQPDVRSKVVSRLSKVTKQLGVDGVALDLSTRTPALRPAPLAKICKQERDFCDRYAQGMDALFDSLKKDLPPGGFLAYNGLYSYAPRQVEDQARLLDAADAAAVEYFGMDPNEPTHSFSEDILPYLKELQRLPPKKAVMFFGRGPWTYTSYVQDYEWQRYLYASFLLAARDADSFKYHASFQVPAHKGRSGGLEYYADWKLDLGNPAGPFTVNGGVYRRNFAHGLVLVAPDDGGAGNVRLDRTYLTPEGQEVSGNVSLERGQGLILLEKKAFKEPAERLVYEARTMGAWNWAAAKYDTRGGPETPLKLERPPADLIGEHDLMLDYERSLTPYHRLEIQAKALGPEGAVLAVAEVDDPRKEYTHVVVQIGGTVAGNAPNGLTEAIAFRAQTVKSIEGLWPVVRPQVKLGQGVIQLSGPETMEGTGLRFRKWAYLRMVGPLEVHRVSLANPKSLVDRGGR